MLSCNVRDHMSIGRGIWTNHPAPGATYELKYGWGKAYSWYEIYNGIQGVEGISAVFIDGSARWVKQMEMEVIGRPHVNVWGVMPN
jgi:hypothetical protein